MVEKVKFSNENTFLYLDQIENCFWTCPKHFMILVRSAGSLAFPTVSVVFSEFSGLCKIRPVGTWCCIFGLRKIDGLEVTFVGVLASSGLFSGLFSSDPLVSGTLFLANAKLTTAG